MAILDFLKSTKKGTSQITELEGNLQRLRDERKKLEPIVESHGTRRADMLLSAATEQEIVDADKAAELAALKLERLELAEMALLEQIAAARDSDARQRRASEMDAAAAAIATKTAAVDAAASAFAAAYRDLLSAVPADMIDVRILKPRFSVDGAATPVDIARAIAAQALAASCPELFETHPPHVRVYGNACAKTLGVLVIDERGRLSPVLAGEHGEKANITSAEKAAERFVIERLREKARALRGSADVREAAE